VRKTDGYLHSVDASPSCPAVIIKNVSNLQRDERQAGEFLMMMYVRSENFNPKHAADVLRCTLFEDTMSSNRGIRWQPCNYARQPDDELFRRVSVFSALSRAVINYRFMSQQFSNNPTRIVIIYAAISINSSVLI
jgi:hypothetical protein